MRRIRYAVAMSLDAYIAGPADEYDWIIQDPDIDFGEVFGRFDTVLMGRRTFEVVMAHGGVGSLARMKVVVVSRTLRQQGYPDVTVLGGDFASALAAMRTEPGKDIWLFGGGSLFRSLLEARLVDTVEVAVIPVLLGGGLPLLSPPARRSRLKLINSKIYRTGIVSLEYAIEYETPDDPPGASGASSSARKGRHGTARKAGKRRS